MAVDIDSTASGVAQTDPQAQPPTPTSQAAPAAQAQQSQAQAPPAQQRPTASAEEDQTPGHFFKHLSHSFAGAIIGALAGDQGRDYSIDENGKQVSTPRPDSTRSRLQRIAQAAMVGLAAGAQVHRPGANALAGFGAGFEAQQRQQMQQDQMSRMQAQEQFEQQQKALMDKAIRASHNASTYSLWQKAMDTQNDHDPERAKNMDIKTAADDYIARNPSTSMQTQIVTDQEAHAMREADNHSIAKHTFLPLGMKQATDADGKPLMNPDGTPKTVGQILVISGGTDDGKIPLPQSFVDDAHQYGKLAGIQGADTITAGAEVPLQQFLGMDRRINEAKKRELDGWDKAKDVVLEDGSMAQYNEVTGKTRPYPAGAQPNAENKPAAQAVEADLKKAETAKSRAETNKANIEANQQKQLNPAGAEGLTGEAYLNTLPQGQRDVIRAIGEGRETRTPRQLQDKNGNPSPLAIALNRAYPDFDDKKASAYGGLVKDFTTGPTSRTLTAYGTAINHARALYDNTGPNSYIPGTDEYKRYNQDVTYVATEVAKALNPTGVPTESSIREQEAALRSLVNRKAAIENAAHILSGKMSEIRQRWADGQVRPSYQPPMPSLSKEALNNADYLRNKGQYQVTDPNGKAHTFPDQNSADKFKKLAGIE